MGYLETRKKESKILDEIERSRDVALSAGLRSGLPSRGQEQTGYLIYLKYDDKLGEKVEEMSGSV